MTDPLISVEGEDKQHENKRQETKVSPLRFTDNGDPELRWAAFDGMIWPIPDRGAAELEWRLRYGLGTPDRSDLLAAASIVAAYAQMVRDPQSKRNAVVRCLREAQRRLEAQP